MKELGGKREKKIKTTTTKKIFKKKEARQAVGNKEVGRKGR